MLMELQQLGIPLVVKENMTCLLACTWPYWFMSLFCVSCRATVAVAVAVAVEAAAATAAAAAAAAGWVG